MKFFYNTSFQDFQKTSFWGKKINSLELISFGMVDENGNTFFRLCNEFDVKAAWNDEWRRENVLAPIFDRLDFGARDNFTFTLSNFKNLVMVEGVSKRQIGDDLLQFIHDQDRKIINSWRGTESGYLECLRTNLWNRKPKLYGYRCAFDHVLLNYIFGGIEKMPRGFPSYTNDMIQVRDIFSLSNKWLAKNCPRDMQSFYDNLNEALWCKGLYEAIVKETSTTQTTHSNQSSQ